MLNSAVCRNNAPGKAAVILLAITLLWGGAGERLASAEQPVQRKSRAFRLDYRFSLKGIEPGAAVRVWVPVPESDRWQTVEPLGAELPTEPQFHVEPKFCNQVLYCVFAAPGGDAITINIPYRVTRRAVLAPGAEAADEDGCSTDRDVFLQPDSLVPIGGRPLELFEGRLPIGTVRQRARSIYDLVGTHVRYDKSGTGWGRGDVLWVCDSGRGNCSDFHSLFISLARSQGIPAKFEVGFPIPAADAGEIGGYHCWAWFEANAGEWLPVDISEADKLPDRKEFYFGRLTADRVAFTVGRDIDLVPQQTAPPLNFFIYPHVEVDGRPLPAGHVDMKVSYRDLRPAEVDR